VTEVERDGLRLLVFPALEALGLRCALSTRPIDVRRPEDRERFVRALGLDPERVVSPRQVHHADVVRVDVPPREPPEADGLVTDAPGLGLLLRAADCSLVVVADPEHRALGMVHAGWKGSARGVVVNLVKAMHDQYGSRPSRLAAAIAPTIRTPCFEVGPEVPAAFLRSRSWTVEYVHHRQGRLYFDLEGVNARFLLECGVPAKAIGRTSLCTFSRPDLLWSYRRDGAGGGHQGLLAAWAEDRGWSSA